MHKFTYIVLLVVLASACQKDGFIQEQGNKKKDIATIKSELTTVLSASEYNELNWDNAVGLSNNGETFAYKIAYRGSEFETVKSDLQKEGQAGMEQTGALSSLTAKRSRSLKFVLVNVDLNGKPTSFFRNEIQYEVNAINLALPVYIVNMDLKNGRTRVYDLRDTRSSSTTTPLRKVKPQSLVGPGGTLPMVTIVGTYSDGGTYSVDMSSSSAYMLAGTLGLDGGGSGGDTQYLEYLDPLSTDGGGSGTGGYEVIEWEMDESPDAVGVDISKYLNCFNSIPDQGASYSVKVMVDIPVDANPNSLVNIGATGLSVGHVFFGLTKTNGSQSITQVLGFYPATGYKSLTLQPVDSKIADDAVSPGHYHEYNASLTLNNFNSTDFRSLLYQLQMNSTYRYEIDGFNCANFVGSSINAVKPGTIGSEVTVGINPLNPLEVVDIQWSPNGVYKFLVNQQNYNPSLAPSIETGVVKNAPQSNGACY